MSLSINVLLINVKCFAVFDVQFSLVGVLLFVMYKCTNLVYPCRGGFYNVKVRDGLRVISLQTNFANSINW